MSIWSKAWKVVDVLLGLAMRADERNERRKARKRFRDLVDARQRDDKTLRSRAPTVVTSRPREADGAPPTAPTRPGRGR